MGKRVSNEDAGLPRRPSAFALFCSEASRTGVSEPPTRRLSKKSPVKGAAALKRKWQLVNMFIVRRFAYFVFSTVLSPSFLPK